MSSTLPRGSCGSWAAGGILEGASHKMAQFYAAGTQVMRGRALLGS